MVPQKGTKEGISWVRPMVQRLTIRMPSVLFDSQSRIPVHGRCTYMEAWLVFGRLVKVDLESGTDGTRHIGQ
jgi:hypothetical protein